MLGAGCSQSGGGQSGANPILLGDENNYHASATLAVPTVETAAGVDLDICWPNLTSDLQCHPVAPQADIDNVSFLRLLHLSEAEVQAKLAAGQVTQSEVDGYVEFRTQNLGTCTKLSRFSFLGTKVDVLAEYQPSADETYLVLFTHGLVRGVGSRAMVFLRPTATSTNTRVDAPSGCGELRFSADIVSRARVAVPAAGPWVVSWRGVTRDGQGNEIIYSTLDKLLIGYYQGATVADVQSRFFDLETMATALWDLPLGGGYTADLSQATHRQTGAPFAGFGLGGGAWLLGLTCSTCSNPAPVILVVLEPSGGKT